MNMAVARRRARLGSLLAAQASVAPSATGSRLEVAELTLHPVREPLAGRAYTILRVKTRGGLIGYGECFHATAEDLAAARRFWTGRAATAYVSITESPLAGALDMALLDIIGKFSGVPVYRILGGPTRNKVRAFTSIAGSSDEDRTASLRRATTAGYRAFGLRVPPPAARNQGQAYQLEVRRLAALIQSQGGDFVLEGAGMLTPGDAASVAATVQPLHPLWFDEPCSIGSLQTLHKIADESVVPLGFGRDVRAPGAWQDLLRGGLIDVVRPDLLHFGITRARRIAAMAETYYVAVAPHHGGGPIGTAAALHLAASVPNFFIQHIPLPVGEEDRLMRSQLSGGPALETVRDGFAALSTAPGLGITVNESVLEKYHAA